MQVTHIDTCLGSFLLDHHNRPGELLIGVVVDGETSYQEVKDELQSELQNRLLDAGGFDYEAAANAIDEEFSTVSDMDKPFDSSLDVLTDEERDEMLEPCQAWFLLTWTEEPAC